MLSKKNRLLGYQVVPLVIRGRLYSSSSFNLRHSPSPTDHYRVGFVVSKKIYKNAVDRNNLKRRLRSLFKENQNLIPNKTLILVQSKASIKSSTREQLSLEIKTTLQRLNNLYDKKNNPRPNQVISKK